MREDFLSVLREAVEVAKNNADHPSKTATIQTESGDGIRNLQGELLDQTVGHAYKNTRYYRKKFTDARINPKKVGSIEDLVRLNPISKTTVLDNYSDFVADGSEIVAAQFTSGTTKDRFCFYLSRREIEARTLMNQLSFYLSEDSDRKGIMLREIGTLHGPSPVRYPMFTIPIVFYSEIPKTVNYVISELMREHYIRGTRHHVSILATNPKRVRFLARELGRRHINPRELWVRRLHHTGNYLSTSYREFCQEIWGAVVYDAYSLAEIYGGANECRYHTMKHFQPFVIPEVLDTATGASVKPGQEGILTLTALYPFQDALPLIRYWTGDFVRLYNKTCECGYSGVSMVEFLGRSDFCQDFSAYLSPDAPERVISVSKIVEEVEKFDELSSIGTSVVTSIGDIPPRLFMTSKGKGSAKVITIFVELASKVGRDRKKEIADSLKELIEKRHERLFEELRSRIDLRISILPTGKLAQFYGKV